MKRLGLIIISICIIFNTYNVFSKDTVFSLNKYTEEKLEFIKKSYTKNNKMDGFITGGTFLKETIEQDDTSYDDYQIMLIKYKKNGEIKWTFTYGKTKVDIMRGLDYTYDESGNIDGYLVLMDKTEDIDEEITEENPQPEQTSQSLFLKISLDGKLLWEKPTSSITEEQLSAIIPSTNEDNQVDGYIAIGNINSEKTILTKYDRDLNRLWVKEQPIENNQKQRKFTEIIPNNQENKTIGYVLIEEITNDNNKVESKIVRYSKDGDFISKQEEALKNDLIYHLSTANNGFILYGETKEVKLKKGNTSFFLIQYNSELEESWETIGDTPIDAKKSIILYPLLKENKISEYVLLYSNKSDSSAEVVKLDLDGGIEKKVKKINNDYYDFENFAFENNTLYLIGQINCPEDDTCNYDSNSLFLISDEDKVIEVKDNDSKNILVIFSIVVIILAIAIVIRQKRKA